MNTVFEWMAVAEEQLENEENTTEIRKKKTKFKQSKWQNEIRNMENERKCTFSIWKLLTL